MLDSAFQALQDYDWGKDRAALGAIDQAVVDTHGDAQARRQLEMRLVAVMQTDVSRAAKDFICRKLRVIGTSASVPALAALLPRADDSHMARYALEAIPDPAAAGALREAAARLDGELQIGAISSLGDRKDAASVPVLKRLIGGDDTAVASAAAHALGDIRNLEAARALTAAQPKQPAIQGAIDDALLACAESLLAEGRKADALQIYKSLSGNERAKHVRLAAARGVLACAAQ